ncbi:hypothetical protein V8F20_008908 [Naviculisporaceae sp. PSN 640]
MARDNHVTARPRVASWPPEIPGPHQYHHSAYLVNVRRSVLGASPNMVQIGFFRTRDPSACLVQFPCPVCLAGGPVLMIVNIQMNPLLSGSVLSYSRMPHGIKPASWIRRQHDSRLWNSNTGWTEIIQALENMAGISEPALIARIPGPEHQFHTGHPSLVAVVGECRGLSGRGSPRKNASDFAGSPYSRSPEEGQGTGKARLNFPRLGLLKPATKSPAICPDWVWSPSSNVAIDRMLFVAYTDFASTVSAHGGDLAVQGIGTVRLPVRRHHPASTDLTEIRRPSKDSEYKRPGQSSRTFGAAMSIFPAGAAGPAESLIPHQAVGHFQWTSKDSQGADIFTLALSRPPFFPDLLALVPGSFAARTGGLDESDFVATWRNGEKVRWETFVSPKTRVLKRPRPIPGTNDVKTVPVRHIIVAEDELTANDHAWIQGKMNNRMTWDFLCRCCREALSKGLRPITLSEQSGNALNADQAVSQAEDLGDAYEAG